MDKQNKSDIVIYNDGELELDVSINDETVWLNRNQISELFGRDVKTIGKHINNLFGDGELDKFSVVANFATTAADGKTYNIEYYNLDVIISVGYRVKSQKGVRFRQWATSVLKSYIQNGYAINAEKITHQRFKELENDVVFLKLKSAKSEIVLIDNYIDDTVFTLFSKYPKLKVKIYTQTITKQLRLDYQKYQAQYVNIELKEFKSAHDRFVIIDGKEVYHIGASLKDLGKKWFAFSKFEMGALDILKKLH